MSTDKNKLSYEEYFNEVQKMLEEMTAEEFFNMFGMSIEEFTQERK